MATALHILKTHGPDCAMFTPFTQDEAKAVLGLSAAGYLHAMHDGALACSVTIDSDPLARLRFHSLWDLVECAARMDAGWPLIPLSVIDEQVMEASGDLWFSVFKEEPEPELSKPNPCRPFPSPAFFWQAQQTSEPSAPSDDSPVKDENADAIARTTLTAFWRTLLRVNRLIADTVQIRLDDQPQTQLSLGLQ